MRTWNEKLKVFGDRMKKLGIQIQLHANYPWIYIYSVNGNVVKEEDYFHANHGFTIMFSPIKFGETNSEFTDIKKIFEIIRKYK